MLLKRTEEEEQQLVAAAAQGLWKEDVKKWWQQVRWNVDWWNNNCAPFYEHAAKRLRQAEENRCPPSPSISHHAFSTAILETPTDAAADSHRSYLPEMLQMQVLMRLPLLKVFELRCVCKAWNVHLCSKPFLEAWSAAGRNNSDRSLLVMGQFVKEPHMPKRFLTYFGEEHDVGDVPKRFLAYCPSLHRWFRLPLTNFHPFITAHFLPAAHRLACRQWASSRTIYDLTSAHLTTHSPSLLHITASMGRSAGLLAAIVSRGCRSAGVEPSDFAVLVFNPFTGAVKELPPPAAFSSDGTIQVLHHYCMSMLLSNDSSTYRIIISCFPSVLETYGFYFDSLTEGWKLMRSYNFRQGSHRQDIESADFLTVQCYRVKGWANMQVMGYHFATDEWSCMPLPDAIESPVQAPLVRLSPGHPRARRPESIISYSERVPFEVVQWEGRVFLAAHLRPDDGAPVTFQGFAVFELETCPLRRWVQVAITPPQLWTLPNSDVALDAYVCDKFYPDVVFTHWANLICMTYRDCSYVRFDEQSLACECHDQEDRDDLVRCFAGVEANPEAIRPVEVSGISPCPLVYDLQHDKWFFLPPFKGKADFMGLFSFSPTFI